MYSIMKENDHNKYGITEYVADTSADIAKLPTDVLAGSICIVIETSDVYMLNNQREWKQL